MSLHHRPFRGQRKTLSIRIHTPTKRAVGSHVSAERPFHWERRLEPRTYIPPGTAVGNETGNSSFLRRKGTFVSFPCHAVLRSEQPTFACDWFAGFAAHPAVEGLKRCFPAPYVEPLAVDSSPFVFLFGVH